MEDKNLESFRFLVFLYAQLYVSVEMVDVALAKPFTKGDTKRKLRMAMKALERDIKPFVNKLYEDEEEMIFQQLQEALATQTNELAKTKIEDIINEYQRKQETRATTI